MNAPLPPDPYRALGVESSADAGVIKTAYRKLVLKCHPDKFPDPTLKAQKQEEFQRVQQAYEILGDEDRRRDYDLELKAKKLKEELAKRGGAATTNTSAHGRYVNVNIRTAEPPAGWSPSKHSTSKSSPYKPYSKEFSQSWESEIPSRSRVYHDEERRARRTASYEKPKREDSRERRRREEDREREKRREREQEDARKEVKRQQKLTKEREAARERERERKDRKIREEREAAKLKEAKKMRERERERDRDARRKQELEDKARAKSKPYLEHSGYSEDEDDVRRSRAKKSSSPKKQSDSPSRENPTTKQRDRSNPRESAPAEDLKYRETMAFAASYMQKIRSKASKTSPRHTAEVPTYSSAYPDPNQKFAPKRRASGEGKHANDEPKSHTMPPGYVPQAQTAASVPHRVPLNRAFTMQPEHEYSRPVEKHRSARRRRSFDEEDDYYPVPPIETTYHVSSRDRGIPRIINAKYKDPYAAVPGVSFPKVKTAPAYAPEHVATSRRYDEDDVVTSEYSHMQPSYDYRTAAVR
ncbi:hypothetical protein INS49_015610 [Diaporthe citri]|uniref:uncharacterized protein n=1 Tax=Diaporthe citri TaxID=83186 RepID=UPI001C7F7730|nr:uncharacterized protein INS49_015610 [Diaporthe citri]KAG6356223.1 hypothetical protein INS49_015610 [Diaporthe citri]